LAAAVEVEIVTTTGIHHASNASASASASTCTAAVTLLSTPTRSTITSTIELQEFPFHPTLGIVSDLFECFSVPNFEYSRLATDQDELDHVQRRICWRQLPFLDTRPAALDRRPTAVGSVVEYLVREE